ncbi:single-stranded DNA-binding protein [Bacteroides pyogenes]|jgi:single-strand DNA-binding protein|uniref:Single-stranded DNA-binding protein n=1 Tax=Bacteroides pyogenes TaxID=310300 RepID=A0A5D3EBB9_9BACE|nr:single-stranded DNA-binding protein [Bacteroides pyogenes]TYK32840.1 single-stranded DNA-binding protein [Bacteroides pyogenes]
MLIAQLIGYIGSDAKQLSNGNYSFPVSFNQRDGETEKTIWINCYLNFNSKVTEYLKKGVQVYITGDLNISSQIPSGSSSPVPIVKINVSKIQLLSSKKEHV